MDFVSLNEATAAGKAVIAYIEAQRTDDVAAFNALPGHVKHYLVNVAESGILTPEQWLRDYPYAAGVIFSQLEAEQKAAEQAEKVEATSGKAEQLAESLEELKTQLAAALSRIDELESAKAPAKAKKQAAVEEVEAESDDEGES